MSEIMESPKMFMILLGKWIGFTPCQIPTEGDSRYRAISPEDLSKVDDVWALALSAEPHGHIICKIKMSNPREVELVPMFERDVEATLKFAKYIRAYLPMLHIKISDPENASRTNFPTDRLLSIQREKSKEALDGQNL